MNQICTSLHPVFNHINLFHGSCRILQNSLVHTAFSISAEVSTVLFHFELNPQTVLIYEKQNRKSHSWKPDWALELNAKRSMMLWFIYNWGFSFIFFYYFFTTLELVALLQKNHIFHIVSYFYIFTVMIISPHDVQVCGSALCF